MLTQEVNCVNSSSEEFIRKMSNSHKSAVEIQSKKVQSICTQEVQCSVTGQEPCSHSKTDQPIPTHLTE